MQSSFDSMPRQVKVPESRGWSPPCSELSTTTDGLVISGKLAARYGIDWAESKHHGVNELGDEATAQTTLAKALTDLALHARPKDGGSSDSDRSHCGDTRGESSDPDAAPGRRVGESSRVEAIA